MATMQAGRSSSSIAPASTRGLLSVASRFERASPEMLRDRALLRRTDTKFLIPADMVVWVLAAVTRDYRLLQSRDAVLGRYRTVYFDTPGLMCFDAHRRGRRPRHKVRVRHYLDLQQTFFEIKTKGKGDVTSKYRHPRTFGDETLGSRERGAVERETGIPGNELDPSMLIDFSRMTLLGTETEERMTIDVDLAYQGFGLRRDLDQVAILEIKQAHLNRRTPIMRALRAHGIRPRSASKYCTVMALGRPGVRINHVRPVLRAVERIQT